MKHYFWFAAMFACAIGLISCSSYASRDFQSLYKAGDTVRLSIEDFHCDSIELWLISPEREVILQRVALPYEYVIPTGLEGRSVAVLSRDSFLNFFRVDKPDAIYSYDIARTDYEGLPVFQLRGGMSAEYAVQKCLENLTGGMSHTWSIGPGGGPDPVVGTFDFLERSIDKTIRLYDEMLGDKAIDNVIIGTGTPLIPYLSAATNSVFLPIHYLVSVNSISEVEAILDYSARNIGSVYATLGYDASMSDVAVAWVKLTDLPKQYKDFIKRHQVKNVIIAGVGEKAHGESFVRKVHDDSAEEADYHNRAIYILYTQGGSDFDLSHIRKYIADYDEAKLDKGKMIADWESGIVREQVDAMTKALAEVKDVDVWSLTAPDDMIAFYNFAMDVSMRFMAENKELIMGDTCPSFVFNEYLISHPIYELLNGYCPVLYWQFVPVEYTVKRMFAYGYDKSQTYLGSTPKAPSIVLNGRLFINDMEAYLRECGMGTISKRTAGIEEVWDLSDGINAPCEMIAEDIIHRIGLPAYNKRYQNIRLLGMEELRELTQAVEGVVLSKEN